MKRVLMLVEGPTEARFVKDILAPHLWERDVSPTPTIVTTKKVKAGPSFKGGVYSFQKIANDLRPLLGDKGAAVVTTMFDYYAFPKDFAGWTEVTGRTPAKRVGQLERALEKHFDHKRFRAYLMLHEYEAMLFTAPKDIVAALNEAQKLTDLEAILADFAGPEEIDEGTDTAPSKRLMKLFRGYRKPLHGPLIVGRIGLPKVRKQCPHFDEWLSKLEELGQE